MCIDVLYQLDIYTVCVIVYAFSFLGSPCCCNRFLYFSFEYSFKIHNFAENKNITGKNGRVPPNAAGV